ncbi:MAG: PAS domain S-box protein [Deltaproteobacteria bacterium]|nr:PAS domain S-box protein [Deltaproteobacteria bacterium]
MPMAKIGFRRLLTVLGILIIGLLALAFILGILSLKRTQEIVSDDFQQQQLILAKTTARQIEDGLAFLRRELRILAYSPSIQYLEDVAWSNRMRISFDELSKMGVTAIERIDFTGSKADQAYILDAGGPRVIRQDFSTAPEVTWARDPANRGLIYQGPIEVVTHGEYQVPIMDLATPVYEESVDESHPKATGKLDGVLIFKIDVSTFAANYCADIRSGRTGYCWVMDNKGVFLYHPEKVFIGQDAFTARGRRNPAISFAQINEIQKTKMLAGEEGKSRYISGWHRGVIRQMEKFVAFSHANVERTGDRIWPVAVVAPTDEVYGTIHSLYVRQFLIQGILIFALICAAAAVIYYESRWSVELQSEVDRTTADLRLSQKQYRSVVENARDLIFLVDEDGAFLSANTAMARVFGIPAAGIARKKIADLLSREDADAMLSWVQDAVQSRKSSEIKAPMRIKDRVFWFSTHFVPIFGEDGRSVEQVLVMARDITDRQQMENQMAQTEKLASLGTLAAGVAHEINNPVGVMLGFTELLLDKLPPDSKEHEMLKTIERQGLNAKRIVENLMTFARQPAKHEEFTDINEDIANVLALVQNNLLTKKVDVELRLAKGLPRVRGDAGELQQVFLNLINNAAAAMPNGGKLTVITKTNPYNHMVETIFADTGTGIPKKYADRIFVPFFTTKKVGEGTGLGLAVSYAIVNKYSGSIRFESRAAEDGGEGARGTTFFVDLQPEYAAAPAKA